MEKIIGRRHILEDWMKMAHIKSSISDQVNILSILKYPKSLQPCQSLMAGNPCKGQLKIIITRRSQHWLTICLSSLSLGVISCTLSSGGGGTCIQLYCLFSTGIPYLAAWNWQQSETLVSVAMAGAGGRSNEKYYCSPDISANNFGQILPQQTDSWGSRSNQDRPRPCHHSPWWWCL